MGVITSQSRVMVDVTFARKTGIGTQTKRKQPCSLVLLEPGLSLVQDANGSVWVRSMTQARPPSGVIVGEILSTSNVVSIEK